MRQLRQMSHILRMALAPKENAVPRENADSWDLVLTLDVPPIPQEVRDEYQRLKSERNAALHEEI